MSNEQTIMIVDDDPNISQLIDLYVRKEGYRTVLFSRGDDAVNAALREEPALIILDIMLPGMSGWDVCRAIRKSKKTPIIMLTAKDETMDKVLGFELGADDYITKPFEPSELTARIKAVLRRTQPEENKSEELHYPSLTISLKRYEAVYRGNTLEMPPKEIEVLYYLASHPNQVFTREQLLEQVWGFDFYGDSRTVDVHVKRIREKLENCEELGWMIRTVWGVGYKFEVKE